jgi:protein SCO1/2
MLALGSLVFVAGCGSNNREITIGTKLNSLPASDFSLMSHRGEEVSLHEHNGHVILLTFLFTTCPDICPLIASELYATMMALRPDQRDLVTVLGITVDPEFDDADAMDQFTQRHGLDQFPTWHGLIGERSELESVWNAYGIDPVAVGEQVERHRSGRVVPLAKSHTDAVFLIDKQGNQRALLRSGFDPEKLASEIAKKLLS